MSVAVWEWCLLISSAPCLLPVQHGRPDCMSEFVAHVRDLLQRGSARKVLALASKCIVL